MSMKVIDCWLVERNVLILKRVTSIKMFHFSYTKLIVFGYIFSTNHFITGIFSD